MQNEPKGRLIFVKKFGKFWEVADFREFVTNGKVWFWGVFSWFLAENALIFGGFKNSDF